MSYYPEPNKPGSADGSGTGNYYYPGNNTDRFDSELGRIDVNITSRNKLSFGFRHNDRYHASNNLFNNIATGSILIQPNWGSSVDDVHTFSPKTVWENRANWTRNIESRPLAASFDFSQLGFPPSLVAASTQKGFPVTTGSAFANFGYSGGDYIPFDSFQIFSILSHTAGKHSLSGGVDLRLYKGKYVPLWELVRLVRVWPDRWPGLDQWAQRYFCGRKYRKRSGIHAAGSANGWNV